MAIGVQLGAANDFNKILNKTIRGSILARFPAGESKSVAESGRLGINVGLGSLVGAIFPADLNSAAKIFFEVSIDDRTYAPLYDSAGTRIEATITLSGAVPLEAADFHGWDFVRLQTVDSGGTAVAQVSSIKDITLVVARV